MSTNMEIDIIILNIHRVQNKNAQHEDFGYDKIRVVNFFYKK